MANADLIIGLTTIILVNRWTVYAANFSFTEGNLQAELVVRIQIDASWTLTVSYTHLTLPTIYSV